jgi:hypothetical protein
MCVITEIIKLLYYISCYVHQCSAKCGTGVQQRDVFCGTLRDEMLTKLASFECESDQKPSSEQECTSKQCGGDWFTAPYGKVSFYWVITKGPTSNMLHAYPYL